MLPVIVLLLVDEAYWLTDPWGQPDSSHRPEALYLPSCVCTSLCRVQTENVAVIPIYEAGLGLCRRGSPDLNGPEWGGSDGRAEHRGNHSDSNCSLSVLVRLNTTITIHCLLSPLLISTRACDSLMTKIQLKTSPPDGSQGRFPRRS